MRAVGRHDLPFHLRPVGVETELAQRFPRGELAHWRELLRALYDGALRGQTESSSPPSK